jgi:ribosomal protein S12 methylthiotransferase
LVEAGTKELLVISQDTSAYGVDIRHQPRMWHGEEVRAHMTDFARKNHSHPPDNSAHQHQAQR